MLHVVLVVFFLMILICGIETFSVGVSPTVKYARVNDTFHINCFVHQAGEQLDFYDGDDLVPETYIKRINDSHAVYTTSYSKPIKKNITCKMQGNIVGVSEVYVDEKFGTARDFKCRTKDLKELTCTFQRPSSYHPITYGLHYVINNGENNHKCELKQTSQGRFACKIKLNENEDPLKTTFNFTLRGRSEFHRRRENFDLTLMETVMQPRIENVKVLLRNHSNYEIKSLKNSVANDVYITFTLPKILEAVASEMMFEVKIKPLDDVEWETIIFDSFEQNINNLKILNLKNIKYANTIYQFKLRTKTKSSMDLDEMWSPYVEKTFKTHPKLPEMIPSTCENCYNIMDNGNIYVYWTEVPKFFQNGDNFSYFVEILNPKTNMLHNTTVYKTSYMLTSKKNENIDDYLSINIYSSNHLGLSKNSSKINVYLKQKPNIIYFKKELIQDGYKLSWKPIYDGHVINNYTIIWCRQTIELPNQCDGPIQFQYLPSDEREFRYNTSHSYQFGVTANTLKGSTRGIKWAKCTSSRPDEIGVVYSIWTTNITVRSIILGWKINCADKDIISGYHIKYCVVADNNESVCLEEEIDEIFKLDGYKTPPANYEITNLKPYRLYKISISMISTSGRLGAFSKSIMARTSEGSPTEPRNLKAINVQSNSISLQWEKPIQINGVSLTYELWYNGDVIHIYNNNDTMNDTFNYLLNNLESFSKYKITVVACTRVCSRPSDSIVQRTAIGKPGIMDQPIIEIEKNGSILLSWTRPAHLGGYLNYFLLKIIKSNHYESEVSYYRINGQRNSCVIKTFNCDKSNFFFAMRAVNIDTKFNTSNPIIDDSEHCLSSAVTERYDNEMGHFYGDLSPQVDHICGYSSLFLLLGHSPVEMIIILCILILLILCAIGYFAVKVYHKLQDMKDIQILWPEGFDPNGNFKLDPASSLSSFDLIKTCKNLENIREESFKDLELYENDYQMNENACEKATNPISIETNNKEHLIPLVVKSETFDLIRNESVDIKIKSSSVPTTPLRNNANDESSKIGYIPMHQPKNSLKNTSNPGYLDMTGKSSNSALDNNLDLSPRHVIKSFIENSQLNNGYIQRNSMKNSLPVKQNSSGYVGIHDFIRK